MNKFQQNKHCSKDTNIGENGESISERRGGRESESESERERERERERDRER